MRIGRLILRGWNFLANVFGTEALAGTKYSLRIVNFSLFIDKGLDLDLICPLNNIVFALKVTKSIDVELDR
jgi:hypothetical protein